MLEDSVTSVVLQDSVCTVLYYAVFATKTFIYLKGHFYIFAHAWARMAAIVSANRNQGNTLGKFIL